MVKKITSLTIALLMIFSLGTTAFAQDSNEPYIHSDLSAAAASFDLTSHESQTAQIQLPNGEIGTVSLRYVSPPKTRASYPLENGTWEIYWETGFFNVQYFIDIENSRISDAYDLNYSTFGCSVDEYSLSHTSLQSVAEMRYVVALGIGGSFNGYLKATISGNKLITKYSEVN